MSALRAQVDAFPLFVPFRCWWMRAHGRVSTRTGIVKPGPMPNAEMKWRSGGEIAGSHDGKCGEHPANWRRASIIGASSASSKSAKPGFEGNAVTRITFPFMPGPYTSRLGFAFARSHRRIPLPHHSAQGTAPQFAPPFPALLSDCSFRPHRFNHAASLRTLRRSAACSGSMDLNTRVRSLRQFQSSAHAPSFCEPVSVALISASA